MLREIAVGQGGEGRLWAEPGGCRLDLACYKLTLFTAMITLGPENSGSFRGLEAAMSLGSQLSDTHNK